MEGKRCWYKSLSGWHEGVFLAWSTDYEELQQGIGQFPVAILMSNTQVGCFYVHPHEVSFAEDKPAVR